MQQLYTKAIALQALSQNELTTLYEKAPLSDLMFVADQIRKVWHPKPEVSWQIDRNINITNVCIAGCTFCNFHCRLGEKDRRYTTQMSEYETKINELFALGGDQVLLQGGLHPHYGLDFYIKLFSDLKARFPQLKIHSLGPPEIAHIAKLEKTSYTDVLQQLMKAGLDSLPGAGAEILNERVRKILSPNKPTTSEWLEVMRAAHQLNLPTSATMMFGHIETITERIEHLILLRDVQNERPANTFGFLAFIPWPVFSEGTKMAQQHTIRPVTAAEYIRMLAISRIALINIPSIQASWLTVGKNTAQLCLHAGANDFGSIMIEEHVVSAAGADYRFDAQSIQQAILDAGFTPWLRNQKYEARVITN